MSRKSRERTIPNWSGPNSCPRSTPRRSRPLRRASAVSQTSWNSWTETFCPQPPGGLGNNGGDAVSHEPAFWIPSVGLLRASWRAVVERRRSHRRGGIHSALRCSGAFWQHLSISASPVRRSWAALDFSARRQRHPVEPRRYVGGTSLHRGHEPSRHKSWR